MVAFKRPKRVKDIWRVVYIENDVDNVKWSNDKTTPNYIKLEREVQDRDGTKKIVQCWTCENQLKSIGNHGKGSRSR